MIVAAIMVAYVDRSTAVCRCAAIWGASADAKLDNAGIAGSWPAQLAFGVIADAERPGDIREDPPRLFEM
jgi:hypothetical protein